MFQRLFLTALLASVILVSACSSVTPARFQRGFTVGGTVHETVLDKDGEASHFMVSGMPIRRMAAYTSSTLPCAAQCSVRQHAAQTVAGIIACRRFRIVFIDNILSVRSKRLRFSPERLCIVPIQPLLYHRIAENASSPFAPERIRGSPQTERRAGEPSPARLLCDKTAVRR